MPKDDAERRSLLTRLQTSLPVMTWGDHTAMPGHGYLLYTITPMFDPATYASPTKSPSNIQRLIEKPKIYILAQASDSAEDKLLYVPERQLDIQQLQLTVDLLGLPPIQTELRAFKRDNPEQQFELGVNQSGHYKCSGCGAHTSSYSDLSCCFAKDRISYSDRHTIATAGKFGKGIGRTRPLANLSKKELVAELKARRLPHEGNKTELEGTLKEELRGSHRVPTLLSTKPTTPPDEQGLGSYEVFTSEGLHDMKDHIKNLFEELLTAFLDF